MDCINLLALIQLSVAFNLGLFYLGKQHSFSAIFELFMKECQTTNQSILNDSLTQMPMRITNSSDCIKAKAGELEKSWNKLYSDTYDDDRSFLKGGFGITGLYAGIYGLMCLLCIAILHSKYDLYAKDFIIISGEIILILQVVVCLKYRLPRYKDTEYHGFWAPLLAIVFAIIITGLLLKFDLVLRCFDGFNAPMLVLILIVTSLPTFVFMSYMALIRISVLHQYHKCKKALAELQKSLQHESSDG